VIDYFYVMTTMTAEQRYSISNGIFKGGEYEDAIRLFDLARARHAELTNLTLEEVKQEAIVYYYVARNSRQSSQGLGGG
jgi:hypothetical protein